jgi:mRNA interferase RelE/StbE
VTLSIIWAERAVGTASRYLADDIDGLRQLMDDVDRLAQEPRPENSARMRASVLRRLTAGRYRVLYEVGPGPDEITIVHVGRVG